MTVTVIGLVTVAEGESAALAHYLAVSAKLLERANAVVTKRFSINETVIGTGPVKSVVMVEYPSREAVDLVFLSEEYQALIPTRDKAFSSYDISIAEQMEMA
ncbi:MAG: DUF1330 domain-containing protein [Sulfitobacter sp.]